MTEAEARQRIAEIDADIGDCDGIGCEDCPILKEERRDLRAYLDTMKGETS